ncbi:MAG: DJ-1/PfpI family protein [Xenococcaceae cyanobacterium MO_188.B29]|nr:DJ-1/PfpI family protein [Xenococcaceae cyanobacterium MO_188.B29]
MIKRNLAILIFDGVEVLDFAGPFEVFAVTSELNNYEPFNVFLVAEAKGSFKAVNGLKVISDYGIEDCPHPDILVVPGGIGTRNQMNNQSLITWIKSIYEQAELVMSVCTGTRLLAKAGLLDGLEITTHHEAYDELRQLVPTALVNEQKRFIDRGKILTTGGISAGLDGSMYIVAKLLGTEIAQKTATYMEYNWQPNQKLSIY